MNVSKYIYIYIYFVIWSPSKQALCRFNAGPPPTTPVRHQISTANANTSCLFNSSSHHHGLLPSKHETPTQHRADVLVPAWHESDRPYITYKASRDIKTSRFNAGPPSTTMDQHRTSKVYRSPAGFG